MISNPEIFPDNSAARLLSILTKAIAVKYSKEEKAGVIWARVLNVPNIPQEFLPNYAQLFVLTNSAYQQVTQHYPEQNTLHAGWRDKIYNCLQNFSPYHHQWASVNANLQAPGVIDILQVAAALLSHHAKPTNVNESSIESLKVELEVIKNSILEDNSFSEQLKSFLIRELEKLINCLENFDLYGTEPIQEAIYNIISNTELHASGKPPLIKKLGRFILDIAFTISLINDVADVPKSLTDLSKTIFPLLIEYTPENNPDNKVPLSQNNITRQKEIEDVEVIISNNDE